ncbi:MAG: hypothetical protein GX556_18735 [Fibrobacter sp.]|nr:hypothetical protein [Fibrobacter sp.]
MTTVFLKEKKCYVCGKENRYPLVSLAFDTVGPHDLDGRSSHIRRSSVYLWVQRCISCGYCAMEIAEGNPEVRKIVRSPEYKHQLMDPAFPETANSFLCHSMIMQNQDEYADAGWSAVFAAWICDDNSFAESAIKCREKALLLFARAEELGQQFSDEKAVGKVYITDLFRRCGKFREAASICDSELEKPHPPHVLDMLYLERDLIEKGDTAAHSDSETEDLEL